MTGLMVFWQSYKADEFSDMAHIQHQLNTFPLANLMNSSSIKGRIIPRFDAAAVYSYMNFV